MRITVATALAAALAATGCSSSRCGHAECQPCGCPVAPQYVPADVAPPPVAPPPPAVTKISDRPVAKEIPVAKEAPIDDATTNLSKARQKGYGYGPELTWLVGRLQRVHVPGSDWKLRYLPLSEQDQYGGSVVLSLDARIDEFKDGDVIYIEGEIIGNRPTLYLTGPLYRIKSIEAVPEHNRIAVHPGQK